MKQLFLEDLIGGTEEEIKDRIVAGYEAERENVDRFKILIAYESVGSWGRDSSSFFLLRDKKTGNLYENHASHCSCDGFNGQWEPEKTTLQALKARVSSYKYFPSLGGYDSDPKNNRQKIRDFISSLRK